MPLVQVGYRLAILFRYPSPNWFRLLSRFRCPNRFRLAPFLYPSFPSTPNPASSSYRYRSFAFPVPTCCLSHLFDSRPKPERNSKKSS
jgi:hypothetical protein